LTRWELACGQGTEYQGNRAGNQDDEMCVVVRNNEIKVSDETGRKYYQEVLSYQQKGIDGELKGTNLPAFLASAGRSRRVCCGSMISHPVLQPDASRALTDKRGIGDVMLS